MTFGWRSGAEPALIERRRRREEPTFDPRSLAGLTPGFVFDDSSRTSLLYEALLGGLTVTVISASPEGRVTGKATALLPHMKEYVTDVVCVEAKDVQAADVIAALRGSREFAVHPVGRESKRALSPEAAALLARIDARRERLRREHGTFPESSEIIRGLREHGEE